MKQKNLDGLMNTSIKLSVAPLRLRLRYATDNLIRTNIKEIN